MIRKTTFSAAYVYPPARWESSALVHQIARLFAFLVAPHMIWIAVSHVADQKLQPTLCHMQRIQTYRPTEKARTIRKENFLYIHLWFFFVTWNMCSFWKSRRKFLASTVTKIKFCWNSYLYFLMTLIVILKLSISIASRPISKKAIKSSVDEDNLLIILSVTRFAC